MASNKDILNFETALRVIGQSNFKCIFCGKECFEFFSESISIEHIFNQDFDRKDITGFQLSHSKCNKSFQQNKNYNVDSVFNHNKNYVLTAEKRELIIRTLIKYHNYKLSDLIMTARERAERGLPKRNSGNVAREIFAEILNLEVKMQNEILADENEKAFLDFQNRYNEMLKARKDADLAKFE